MSTKQLLIIDNDECFVRVWSHILIQNGFEVTAIANITEVETYLRTSIPDAIICDINIPGLEITKFCEFLKSSSRTQHVPVIFLSVVGDIRVRSLVVHNSENIYWLNKPFSRQELMEVLAKL